MRLLIFILKVYNNKLTSNLRWWCGLWPPLWRMDQRYFLTLLICSLLQQHVTQISREFKRRVNTFRGERQKRIWFPYTSFNRQTSMTLLMMYRLIVRSSLRPIQTIMVLLLKSIFKIKRVLHLFKTVLSMKISTLFFRGDSSQSVLILISLTFRKLISKGDRL